MQELDIVEYAIFEASGCLQLFADMPLKCTCVLNSSGDAVHFHGNNENSTIYFGFHVAVNEVQEKRLEIIASELTRRTGGHSFRSYTPPDFGYVGLYQSFYLDNTYIQKAIENSAVFKAAGDLSALSLETLFILKEKMSAYRLYDKKLADVVTLLDERLTNQINTFPKQEIEKAKNKTFQTFNTRQRLSVSELELDALLRKLEKFAETLPQDGNNIFYTGFTTGQTYIAVRLVEVANTLVKDLNKAKEAFFNDPNEENLTRFQTACHQAIDAAKPEFAQHRSLWLQMPILRAILGVIAAITVVPAITVAVKSQYGFVGTFFESKTDLTRQLETFETKLCDEAGVMEHVSSVLNSNSNYEI